MKQLEWKIVYHKYEGVYTLYVSPCEKEGRKIEKNAIVVGLLFKGAMTLDWTRLCENSQSLIFSFANAFQTRKNLL